MNFLNFATLSQFFIVKFNVELIFLLCKVLEDSYKIANYEREEEETSLEIKVQREKSEYNHKRHESRSNKTNCGNEQIKKIRNKKSERRITRTSSKFYSASDFFPSGDSAQ